MDDAVLSPARRTLEAQLASPRVLCGEDRGRWSILKLNWPHLYVRVNGRDAVSGRVFTHDFRLECDGYPDPGPFVERWAFAENETLGSKPPAPATGSPGFIDAMKEWSDGGIYRAWQRTAAAHNGWAQKRPDEAWHRGRDISFILEHLYALLSEQAVWLAARP